MGCLPSQLLDAEAKHLWGVCPQTQDCRQVLDKMQPCRASVQFGELATLLNPASCSPEYLLARKKQNIYQVYLIINQGLPKRYLTKLYLHQVAQQYGQGGEEGKKRE